MPAGRILALCEKTNTYYRTSIQRPPVTTTPRSAMTPHLLATTPSLPHKPYDATLGNNAMLGDDDTKLGEDATPLLMTTTMTTAMTAAVAAAAAVARTTKMRR